MTATKITATKRFIRPNVTKVYWVPTLADYNNPLRTELDAGTDVSGEISDVSGWSTTSNSTDTPDWGSRFTSQIPGNITADSSSITFYGSSDTQDIRTLLNRDDTGFVVWMDGGDVPTQLMDVFPVTVSSLAHQRTMSDPAAIQVSFTITDVPAENVAIPAAA